MLHGREFEWRALQYHANTRIGALIFYPMKIISWNVRGLEVPSKRHAIQLNLTPHHVDILLLQESKLLDPSPSQIREIGGPYLTGWAHSNSIGSKGGLITLWNESVWSHYRTISHNSALHVSLCHLQTNTIYFFSNIYGSQDAREREVLWSNCISYTSYLNGPWVLGGDFNTMRTFEDRNSGNTSHDTEAFNSFINSCYLIDPPIKSIVHLVQPKI